MFKIVMIVLAIISFTVSVFLFCLYCVKSKQVKEEYYANNSKSTVKDLTAKKFGE